MTVVLVLCETILFIVYYTDALAYQAAWVGDFAMMLRLQKFVHVIKSWKIVETSLTTFFSLIELIF